MKRLDIAATSALKFFAQENKNLLAISKEIYYLWYFYGFYQYLLR